MILKQSKGKRLKAKGKRLKCLIVWKVKKSGKIVYLNKD